MWRIAVGQLTSTSSPAHNSRICRHLIQQASKRGCQALFLPESSDFIADPGTDHSAIREAAAGLFEHDCIEAAKEAGLWLFLGLHRLPSGDPHSSGECDVKPLNALLAVNGASASDADSPAAEYHKIHLFDQISTSAGTGSSNSASNESRHAPVALQESSTTARGRLPPPTISVSDRIKVGLAICYDIRFPELSRYLVEQGKATVIAYPSAFTVPTGRDHWEILCRARAIETQCYVIASAQIGQHNQRRKSWGGSMVVDPWGKIILKCPTVDDIGELAEINSVGDVERYAVPSENDSSSSSSGSCWLGVCEIDMDLVESIRTRMPLALHRGQREYSFRA